MKTITRNVSRRLVALVPAILLLSGMLFSNLFFPAPAFAAEKASEPPDKNCITVTNYAQGTSDIVYVYGLAPKDVVKVYNAASNGKMLAKKTVSSSGSDVTIKISQLGTTAGNVYISVTSKNCTESSRTEAKYDAEPASAASDAGSIIVTNNAAGTSDTVYVGGLNGKDIVQVYNAATGGKLLGKKNVSSSGSDVTIKISQLGTTAGSVYVSVTGKGYNESARTEAKYDAEPSSTPPVVGNVTVTNNAAGTSDTVYVTGLNGKDIVKVYNAATGGKLLEQKTVSSSGSDVTIKITQLGTTAGSVYVSVTSKGCVESDRTEAGYAAEGASEALDVDLITVTNNPKGTKDTVYVSGVEKGDIIKVYNAAAGGELLGKGTATTSVTISITQLGAEAGTVYVSRTSSAYLESSRVAVAYEAESNSTVLAGSDITVTNNAKGTKDTVYVQNLSSGDVIKVYSAASGGSVLGTATATSTEVTVSISQLGIEAGSVYVSVTSKGMNESSRVTVAYEAEAASVAPAKISVNNHPVGTADTVYVSGLTSGDLIKVYSSPTGGTALGKATASGTTATVSISQLGATAGSVYVSVTSTGKTESVRTAATYDAEPVSAAPEAGNIAIDNHAGAADVITVIGLLEGDLVTVYKTSDGLDRWASGTVASLSSTITLAVSQLGTSSGSVYVSVTSDNALESSRIRADYLAEIQSDAPATGDVTVVNNYNIASTVTVTGLANNDVVNVYNAAAGGTLLGTATASAYGTSVTISLSGLNAAGGTIYLTVTSTNESESTRTAVDYSAHTVSTAPAAADVTILNNADLADTITVTNTTTGTIISVYDAEMGGNLLGTATASGTSVTISLDQLGAGAGSVYVTATTSGKTESARTEATYVAESASDALKAGNVTIANKSGASDTITITGLSSGAVVKVYKAASGGTYIATATSTGNLTTVITVSQLGTSSGSVYLTVTTSGKTESDRTEVSYSAESTAPEVANVTIVNNAAGTSDTITVKGLTIYDVVNIYSDSSGTTLLGTATVSSSSATSVTISVSQLSAAAGYIYVSVTNPDCAESALIKVSYLAEQTTDAPDAGDIVVVNNASGTKDTITVSNLSSGYVVKVYNVDGDPLGQATVSSGSTSATVTVSNLGSDAGIIYVTVKAKGKLESEAVEVIYPAE